MVLFADSGAIEEDRPETDDDVLIGGGADRVVVVVP